jgi:hypothetical protein
MVNKVVAELAKAHPHDLLLPSPSFTQFAIARLRKEKKKEIGDVDRLSLLALLVVN